MRFELTEAQVAQVAAWADEQDRLCAIAQKAEIAKDGSPDPFKVSLVEAGIPYYGAIGGELTYSFSPTSIGVVIKIKHSGTKAELDISDYESW